MKIGLSVFQQVSGLEINLHKSEVLVTNVDSEQTEELVRIFGCRLATFPSTYLGLPLSDKLSKRLVYP